MKDKNFLASILQVWYTIEFPDNTVHQVIEKDDACFRVKGIDHNLNYYSYDCNLKNRSKNKYSIVKIYDNSGHTVFDCNENIILETTINHIRIKESKWEEFKKEYSKYGFTAYCGWYYKVYYPGECQEHLDYIELRVWRDKEVYTEYVYETDDVNHFFRKQSYDFGLDVILDLSLEGYLEKFYTYDYRIVNIPKEVVHDI